MKNATYLIPIWFDVTCEEPDDMITGINDLLQLALEEIAANLTKYGGQIDAEWTINKRMQRERT